MGSRALDSWRSWERASPRNHEKNAASSSGSVSLLQRESATMPAFWSCIFALLWFWLFIADWAVCMPFSNSLTLLDRRKNWEGDSNNNNKRNNTNNWNNYNSDVFHSCIFIVSRLFADKWLNKISISSLGCKFDNHNEPPRFCPLPELPVLLTLNTAFALTLSRLTMSSIVRFRVAVVTSYLERRKMSLSTGGLSRDDGKSDGAAVL